MVYQDPRRRHQRPAPARRTTPGKAALAIALLLAAAAAHARPSFFYFPPDWCPSAAEWAQIDAAFNTIPMRGTCCLVSGSTRDPAATLSPRLEAKIAAAGRLREPPAACTGRVLTPEEESAIEREADHREAEIAKAAAARQLIDGPATMRAHGTASFCAAYGEAIRDNHVTGLWPHPSAPAWAKAEAKRRGLTINNARVTARQVRLGDTTCQMLAAFGLPDNINRTTIPGVVHIQHVYGRTYVYTRNGIVTGIQD